MEEVRSRGILPRGTKLRTMRLLLPPDEEDEREEAEVIVESSRAGSRLQSKNSVSHKKGFAEEHFKPPLSGVQSRYDTD